MRKLIRILKAMLNPPEHHRRYQGAVDGATKYFETTTGNQAHSSMSRVIAEEADGFIIRVCYGATIPPQRVWYRIDGEGTLSELTFEEAKQFGEKPWR
jgi:hypothetical protein